MAKQKARLATIGARVKAFITDLFLIGMPIYSISSAGIPVYSVNGRFGGYSILPAYRMKNIDKIGRAHV